MHVSAAWRHPVKSFQGEPVERADIAPGGLVGDRDWGVQDTATGRVLTGRRCPDLLLAEAALDADGELLLTLPNGTEARGEGSETDDALSAWLGRPVTLVAAAATPPARAEFFADATDDSSRAMEWTMPAGKYVDAMAVLVLTTASLEMGAALHPVRRLGPAPLPPQPAGRNRPTGGRGGLGRGLLVRSGAARGWRRAGRGAALRTLHDGHAPRNRRSSPTSTSSAR